MDSARSSRWWSEETVAVVTGANKGMGLEVCRQLADKGLKVVLTARDGERGREALEALRKQGLHNVQFHQLDVTDDQSIAAFACWLFQEHGGLDILVNNAAITSVIIDQKYISERNIAVENLLWKQDTSEGFIIEYDSAKACIDVNYYGAKHVTEALFPLLRPSPHGARILNVGAGYGQLNNLQSSTLRDKLADVDQLSEAFIDEMLDRYLNDVKQGSWEGKGWPSYLPSYKMSKVALHAYTRLLAREAEKRVAANQKVFVNCAHPGFVRTDMTFGMGHISVQEGAQRLVRIALLPPQDCPTGQFFDEGKLGTF